MRAFANLFLIAFVLDAGLSLLDELLHLWTGARLLVLPRGLAALVVILATPVLYALLGLTPRLPKRVFLPMLLLVVWWLLGAMPLPLWLGSLDRLQLAGAVLQAGVAGFALLQVRRLTRGTSWLLTREVLRGPGFRFGHTLAFVAVSLGLGAPALALYAVGSFALLIHDGTAGFVGFDRAGVTVSERRYARDDREIVLAGMIHVGESSVYRELFESFATESTVVLEEGVSDQQGRLGFQLSYERLATGLGLDMQPGMEEAIGRARGEAGVAGEWPHVENADVDVADFSPETLAFLERMAIVMASESWEEAVASFRDLYRQTDPETWRAVENDLIHHRNRHLIERMEQALPRYRRVVVPWGALHLPDVERAVREQGFEQVEGRRRRLVRYSTLLAALQGLLPAGDAGAGPPAEDPA